MQAVRTVWGFIKRHRRAIGLGAVTGVAAVVALRKMKASAQNMMEEAMQEVQRMEQEQRLETHLARTRKECRRNVLVFLPMLKKRLDDRADVPAALRQAKQRGANRAQKLASWEQIKVLTLTRLFAGATAASLLVLVLRIQLHIAQRHEYDRIRMSKQSAGAAGGGAGAGSGGGGGSDGSGAGAGAGMTQSESDEAAETTHDFLMAAVEHLLGSGSGLGSGGGAETGLDRIISLVRSIVEAETESWNISTRLKVSSEDLRSLLSTLHAKLPWNELCRCAVWDEGKQAQLLERKERKERKEAGLGSNSARARALSCLLDEALDMLESPHFERAFRESTDAAIGCVTEEIVCSAYPSPADGGSSTSDAANIRGATAVANASAEKPFVALLPQIDKVVTRVFDAPGALGPMLPGGSGGLQGDVLTALESHTVVAFCDAIFRSKAEGNEQGKGGEIVVQA